jgi:hypothetical protein
MNEGKYDIERVDKSLWHYFQTAVMASKKLEANYRDTKEGKADKRKSLFKFPRGAYWSQFLAAPGDTSGLSGVISMETYAQLNESGFLNIREWRIDTTLYRKAKMDNIKYYQEIRLKQLMDEEISKKS